MQTKTLCTHKNNTQLLKTKLQKMHLTKEVTNKSATKLCPIQAGQENTTREIGAAEELL